MKGSFSIQANLVDIHRETIYPAEAVVSNGKIISIKENYPDYEIYTKKMKN